MDNIRIFPILRLGCGCSFVGITVTAGSEPTRPCKRHLKDQYTCIDISFPGTYRGDVTAS